MQWGTPPFAVRTFDLIAGLASILGLWFSLWAWVRAKAASQAAQAARETVLLRTLAEELQAACDNVDDLMDLIEHDRLDEAKWVGRELASKLSEVPHRRSPYLSDQERKAISEELTRLQVVERKVSAARGSQTVIADKEKMLRACRKIAGAMRQILGKIKGEMEREGGS